MGPNIDDLVVALTGRDDTPAVLLLHFNNFFLGLLNLRGLFLGDDHVVHPHGDAGLGCRSKAKRLEIVQHTNRLVLATLAVAIPDDVPESTLVHDDIWEPDLRRPDFTEHNPADSSLDDLLFFVPVWGVFPKIGVGQADHIVNLHLAIVVREQDLLLGAKQAHHFLFFANHIARLGRDVITTQGDILGRGDDRFAAGRRKDVAGRHHQEARLQLGLD